MALGNPAEHEEGDARLRLVEQIQQPVRVGNDAALASLPARSSDDAVEGADLEVVFDVHAHRVDDVRCRRHLGQTPFRSRTVFSVSKMMKRSRLIEKFLM